MKIAILMSTYNGEKYISDQIESLVNQTLKNNITVYIRDDHSTDSSLQIIKDWQDRINIVLYAEENVGPAKSFWSLLTRDIDADYFLFCDQDDVWDDGKVEKSIDVLKDGVFLSYCNCRHIDTHNKVVEDHCIKGNSDVSYENLFISGITQGCSMCFTRELRDFIVKQTINCIPMHDIIVMLYAKLYGEIKWIEEPLFSYRIHENNVVAKNKNKITRFKKTLWNWKNSRNNSMSDVAAELINNFPHLKEQKFLMSMSKYRTSIKDKVIVLRNEKLHNASGDCKRSYICRILLNWL